MVATKTGEEQYGECPLAAMGGGGGGKKERKFSRHSGVSTISEGIGHKLFERYSKK